MSRYAPLALVSFKYFSMLPYNCRGEGMLTGPELVKSGMEALLEIRLTFLLFICKVHKKKYTNGFLLKDRKLS